MNNRNNRHTGSNFDDFIGTETVKVLLYAEPPRDQWLEFELIFEDFSQKHYKLDDYAIKAYRGLNFREIVEDQARQYFESLGQDPDIIKLIFL